MTMTKGRIDRAGEIVFHDASLKIWEEGLADARRAGGFKGEDAWERQFKRDVFARIVQQLNRLGWTVGPWSDAHKYKAIARNHRTCAKGDLQAQLSLSGRCIEFEMWQDVQNVENRNGGKYDFNKESRMTYLQRLEMERTRRRIRDYLCNVFTGYEFVPPKPKCGPDGVTAVEYAARNRRTNGHYVPELDRARIHMESNARAADGGTIEHGAKVWALDYKGRVITGTAYYSLNNSWHIVTGRYGLTVCHTGKIFTRRPENLRVKQNAYERRQRLERELAKATEAMNFERAAVLRDILFPGNPELFVVWHKKHEAYHCANFCGYTRDKIKAGRFTADEVRNWRHEPNEVIALSGEKVAA
ncbi:hypothetical protein [Bordetella phage vB_BbrM_PHB04]|uniref:UVR domain-containing protein n=1 Tax=Bordetella phage vB_BbrM_PHB04 TaxID=2029657 RepID=A0A291L9Z9_9CAUD|nr:hypothetical protein HOS14_gp094 [Bordetella phage vB_BbrM_PHB04]ATI15712.1 hypothetical protein [Bordetella phage vB_BbrM_PHB04]